MDIYSSVDALLMLLEFKFNLNYVVLLFWILVLWQSERKSDGFVRLRSEEIKEHDQLEAEFNVLSSLRHPNVVAYYVILVYPN